MKSNGFWTFHSFSHSSSTRSLSATKRMYWDMSSQFIPIRLTGRASVRNSVSISTASRTILREKREIKHHFSFIISSYNCENSLPDELL